MGQTRFSVGTIQELYHAAHVASQYPDLLTERFPRVTVPEFPQELHNDRCAVGPPLAEIKIAVTARGEWFEIHNRKLRFHRALLEFAYAIRNRAYKKAPRSALAA